MPTYTLAQVKEHNKPDDVWMVIHNKVYDVTKYLEEHPGGSAILVEVAGRDATQEFEDVGHSSEANEWLDGLYIGDLPQEELAEEVEIYRPTFERVSQNTDIVTKRAVKAGLMSNLTKAGAAAAVGVAIWALAQGKSSNMMDWRTLLSQIRLPGLPSSQQEANGSLWWGIAIATAVETSASLGLATYMYSKFDIHSAFPRYKARRSARPDRFVSVRRDAAKTTTAGAASSSASASAVLDAKQYRPFKLVRKTVIAPNVYRMVFALPQADAVLGLPTGQHIVLQAVINGKNVARSYTPISNNSDLGRIEMLIKVYPQGLMTQHLAGMQVGETIDIRGPKGSMQYSPAYAKHIGMIAGGSGITPMYQLIRAICADESDKTQVSLIYANNTEEDILLREELDGFAVQCPEKLKVHYVLAKPPADWTGEAGFVTRDMMDKYLPKVADDTKVLLCGPPPMIEATKKNLSALGFKAPGAISKAADQVFLF